MTAATSSELGEALIEDSTLDIPTNLYLLAMWWQSLLSGFQWQRNQGQRGLLPSYDEAGVATSVRSFFTSYRSYETFWESRKVYYLPEFVEFVEEHRSKAA